MQEFKVKKSEAGQRADIFVASKYPKFTRSSLELLFDKDLVKINGKLAKASAKIQSADRVLVDETYLKMEVPKLDLPILYEDDDIVVIDKPAGVLTHSKGALNFEGTVASFISDKLNDKTLSGNRAGIVHRLDRATSGVMVAAKNSAALSKLQKQFSLRKAKKEYVAIVEGRLEPAEAVIDAPIMRSRANPQTFKVGRDGKAAVTEYHVLKSFKKAGKEYSLVNLKPKTGRTHQLRVHMAYVGHPIVGDKVYGYGGDGNLMLHATKLEITLPSSTRAAFESPLPDRIKGWL